MKNTKTTNATETKTTKAATTAKKATNQVKKEKPTKTVKTVERNDVSATTKTTEKPATAPVENKKKRETRITVPQFTNAELASLFHDNGCMTRTKAKAESVVYNTFGTQSRILQQNKAYQLLLTNGHKKQKDQVVDCDNDDTARFIKWYNKLNKEDKAKITGFETINETKLSSTEMPRERTVKITDKDLLVKFIQYMATFNENKLATTEA